MQKIIFACTCMYVPHVQYTYIQHVNMCVHHYTTPDHVCVVFVPNDFRLDIQVLHVNVAMSVRKALAKGKLVHVCNSGLDCIKVHFLVGTIVLI